jgi:HK97 family phage major capsid protein
MTNYTYDHNFWNMMRGKSADLPVLSSKTNDSGDYLTPEEFKAKFDKALAKDNVFRRLATVVNTTSPEGTIQAVTSTGTADWVGEGAVIPESSDNILPFPVYSYKLASLVRLKNSFVNDNAFDLENYLLTAFARRFGRAEEAAFLNGTGTNQPTGLLSASGAEVGVTAASATAIAYDELTKLYFSLKAEHRANAVFLMHDDTAMALRTLKDTAGNPLWNAERETIFGKPVVTSLAMPAPAAGKKAIAFGDLSYYWVIERQPLTTKRLSELYSVQGQIGFTAFERLDGKLILPEAVKVLKMA